MLDEGEKAGLFASVLHARAEQARARARVLKLVPLVIALHVLLLLGAAYARREPAVQRARLEGEDTAPVLKLLAALPPPPPLGVASSARALVPRKKAAPRFPLRPKPLPVPPEPAPAPAEEVPAVETDGPPEDAADAVAGGTPEGAEGGVIGGVVGGVVQGALAGIDLSRVMAPPPRLTPEQRDETIQRYLETIIRARFMNVRYPHQAAAAGITGQVLLRVSINARGRLLNMELLGRCPHPVLCDSAKEVVRNASPFPPPPPELGTPFLLELPFNYHLH